MKTWKLTVELKVADMWISDGFNVADRLDEIQEKLSCLLPYATGSEFKVKVDVASGPSKREISDLQGY